MRPKGVADAQTVEIPSPPKDLSAGTLLEGRSQVLVLVEIEGRLVPGHDDSHIIRATHSGILTSVNSTTAYAIVSPLTQRSPTPH